MTNDEIMEKLLETNLKVNIEILKSRSEFFKVIGFILFIIGFSLMLVFIIMHESTDYRYSEDFSIYYYLAFSLPFKFTGLGVYFFGKRMIKSYDSMKSEIEGLFDEKETINEG